MDVWSHDGKLYEVASGYSVADDAWHYELTGLTDIPGTGPYLAVVIPDAAPDDGPFTPHPAEHALIAVADGVTPWPVLRRLLDLVVASGDLSDAFPGAPSDGEKLLLSHNLRSSGDQQFEVNSFHYGDGSDVATVHKTAREAGLPAAQARAVADAAAITRALRRKRGSLPTGNQAPITALPPVDGLAAEARWLAQVSRAYASSPLVAALVNAPTSYQDRSTTRAGGNR